MFKKILEKITNVFAPIGTASAGHLNTEKKHPLDGPIRAAEEKTFALYKNEQPRQEEVKAAPVVQEPIANIVLTPSIVIPEETLTVNKPSTVEIKQKRKPSKKAKTSNSKAVARRTVKKDNKKNGTV